MVKVFACNPEALRETAQATLTARSQARSIEFFAESVIPLAANGLTKNRLTTIQARAREISEDLQTIYNEVAQEAFGED